MNDAVHAMRHPTPGPAEIGQGSNPNRPDQPAVEITALNKWFGSFHALKNIDLAVPQGTRIVICGPSGSGKSTLIRCVNGLESFRSGAIRIGSVDLTRDQKQLQKIRREVGMVFQQFNLFPHLTVMTNCTLASRRALANPRPRLPASALAYLERVGIPGEGACISRPALRRSAAARCHRPRALHEPEDHALRRADIGA